MSFSFSFLAFLSLFVLSSSSSSSSSSSESSSEDGLTVTNSLEVTGSFCHGANLQYGQCLSQWTNPNLDLSDESLLFWQAFCLSDISLLSGNDIVQGLDESEEYVASHMTEDMANLLGGVDFWNTILSDDEKEYNPILDSPSIYIGPIVDDTSTQGGFISNRGFVPSFSDMLNNEDGEYRKWDDYHNYIAEQQGLYTLEDWNKANGNVKLECFDDGTGGVEMQVYDLVPNMPYRVLGVFGNSAYPAQDASERILGANDIGGVPSVFYTDENGTPRGGTIKYRVPFCPLDTSDPLMYIALHAHYDYVIAGAYVRMDRLASVTASTQLCFTVADDL